MTNPQYDRLAQDGHVTGLKRTVVEYLPFGSDKWQIEPIEHNPDETMRISTPPLGVQTFARRLSQYRQKQNRS